MLDVDSLLRRLPAEAQARVAWAKKPIQSALARLVHEALTDKLIAEVAKLAWKPLATIAHAFWVAAAANRDELRAVLMEDLRREEAALKSFLADESAAETLDWVLGFLTNLFDFTIASIDPALAEFDANAIEQLGDDPDFQPFIRGQIALMAAVETDKARGHVERARELVDVSFLELVAMRNHFRKLGLWFSAFPHETTEQRRERLLADADRVRSALNDEDWQVLRAARMRDLR